MTDDQLRAMPKELLLELRYTAAVSLSDIDLGLLSDDSDPDLPERRKRVLEWHERVNNAFYYTPPPPPRWWAVLRNPEL